MKLAALLVIVFATNACFAACLPSLLNQILATPLVNNVISTPATATLIPPPVLSAIIPPALAPVVPILNSIFPQGCPAQIVNAILTSNFPAGAGIAAANGIGLPAALSLLAGSSLNVPSVNLPFNLAGSNLIL